MVKILLIFFLLTSPALANCKYYSEADVVNGELVNKKEHKTCIEDNQNFLVTFFTDPKWEGTVEQTFLWLSIIILESIYPSEIIAAEVSSQEDSIPNIMIFLFI